MPKIPPTDTTPQRAPGGSLTHAKPKRRKTTRPTHKASGGGTEGLQTRMKQVQALLGWLKEVPGTWIEDLTKQAAPQSMGTLPCESYDDLIQSWSKAMRWRQDMDDVLSVMLSVALSTVQQGDQLFLMVIGDPGGGKTRLCDGMLTSKHCHGLEYLTGFFSGMKDEEGNDYSLITRVNRKCMITPEGDVMMSNPAFPQIMAQQRRIFDGTGGATYKNMKEDRKYSGLRTPWIIAGTPAMMEKDQASLGDRFLKVYLESPTQDERRAILQKISRSSLESLQVEADGEKLVGEAMQEAYRKTGGYIDWLRDNTSLLSEITVDDKCLTRCEDLGEFIAFMRARPSKNEDGSAGKEEPNRLTAQFVRLMACMTVTINRKAVDKEIMRRVTKTAMNTGTGPVLEIVKLLHEEESRYMTTKALAIHLDMPDDKLRKMMRFLKKIKVVRLSTHDDGRRSKNPLWGLTPHLRKLCEKLL